MKMLRKNKRRKDTKFRGWLQSDEDEDYYLVMERVFRARFKQARSCWYFEDSFISEFYKGRDSVSWFFYPKERVEMENAGFTFGHKYDSCGCYLIVLLIQ